MRCRFALLTALALLAAPVLPAAPAVPPAAPAEAEVQAGSAAALMQRDVRCGQFMADCLVNGRPARLLVDTGATHTVLSADFAARELPQLELVEGLRLSGNATQAPRPALATVTAGGVELKKSLVLLMPLGGVNSLMERPIDGILGMEHLRQLPFMLDLREGGVGRWHADAGAFFPLRGQEDAAGRLHVPARSGDSSCLLLLDTGSNTTTWPEGSWPAGAQAEAAALRVADVNGARDVAAGAHGQPAELRLAGGALLPQVEPLLRAAEGGHVLGLDALRGCLLIHRPGQGFFISAPRQQLSSEKE